MGAVSEHVHDSEYSIAQVSSQNATTTHNNNVPSLVYLQKLPPPDSVPAVLRDLISEYRQKPNKEFVDHLYEVGIQMEPESAPNSSSHDAIVGSR